MDARLMSRYRITFEVDTECDASMVLAAFDDRVGKLLDNGYGTEMFVDDDSISVKAMPPILIQMTYSLTTPESAEHGEDADHGFAAPGGWTYSIADESFYERAQRDGDEKALADMTPALESFDTVADAVDFLASYGPFEASDSELGPNTWLTQTSGAQDRDYFEKGEEKILSFHFHHGTDQDVAIEQALAKQVIAEVLDK